jgi:hypothetical protein
LADFNDLISASETHRIISQTQKIKTYTLKILCLLISLIRLTKEHLQKSNKI